jgi:hypothetical protein
MWIFAPAALAISCSSGPGTSSGGAGATSSASSVTGTSSGGGAAATTGSGGGATGTGGAATCAACITIASLPTSSTPYGLFVDDTNLYWTNMGSGEVMQAKLDGSSPVTLATGEVAPIAVQVKDGFVYWVSYSEGGVARKVPVGGGAVVDLAPAPGARELFVASDFIWWTGEPDDVLRAPIAGLPSGGVADLFTGNPLPNGLAVDETSIYWVNRLDGQVKKADHDLGNPKALATGDIPWDIAVDGTSIYWTEQGTGKVMKASKTDGSKPTIIATDAPGCRALAIDSTRIYWANKNDGTIKSAPLGGGTVTVVAPGQHEPANLAVDASFVYWTDADDDTILKVPK